MSWREAKRLRGMVPRERTVVVQVEVQFYGTEDQELNIVERVRREVGLMFSGQRWSVERVDLSDPLKREVSQNGHGVNTETEARDAAAAALGRVRRGGAAGGGASVGKGGTKSPRGWSGRKFTPPPGPDGPRVVP